MSLFGVLHRLSFRWSVLLGVYALLLAGCGDCGGAASVGGQGGDVLADVGGDSGADTGDTHDGVDAVDAAGEDDAQADGADEDAQVCPAQNQCAQSCCAEGELCLREQCVLPGAACTHNLECAEGEICEPSMERCIIDPGVECIYQPETEIFDPVVDLAWTDRDGVEMPEFNQVMMTPAVIDLNQDDVPDIVFSSFKASNGIENGILRAIDGATYQPIFDLTDAAKRVAGIASLALGDIDADGRVEVVALKPGGRGIIVFDDYTTDWRVMWENDGLAVTRGGPALADLDADGEVELVVANRVYDAATGALRCVASGLSRSAQKSAIADLNGDGRLDVIVANGAFDYAPADGVCPKLFTYEQGHGFPAVGDFGTFVDGQREFGVLDGIPEIVTVSTASTDQIVLHNGQDGTPIWTATFPTDEHPMGFTSAQCSRLNGGGPPTIADFDGDGAPEVGTAGACYYVVIDTDGSLLWKHESQDFSSRTTGSSVFDFQGDGKAEVVYADECFLRVYDGTTGDVLFKQSHSSGTTRELPLIVDVDNDFHAEIVFISNDYKGETICQENWPDYDALNGPKHGVSVVKDAQNRWVSTRPVWNQHTYHVTNVCDGRRPFDDCPGRVDTPGAIPIGEVSNWSVPGLNNYRQNVQGEGLFNAPDLAITNLVTDCEAGDGLTFRITVANLGTRGVPAGAHVAVYVSIDGTEQFLTTLTTTQALLPGGAQTLEYVWADAPDPYGKTITLRALADTDADGAGQHFECNEDNNELQNQATCACQQNSDCAPGEICVTNGQCLPMGG